MKNKVRPVQEERIRKRVEGKFQARRDLIQHFAVYLMINSFLWLLYLPPGGFDFPFDFPWPIFVTGFWGIGVVSQYVGFYYKHGRGAEKREAEIEKEVTRQMRGAEQHSSIYEADEYADGEVFGLNSIEARQVRLQADGELADSFIDQAGYDEKQKRAGR